MSDKASTQTKFSLIAAVLAAIGASLCCAGPLVLLLLGVSGSWVSQLALFEPLKPIFIGLTALFFIWAGWQLYRPQSNCQPDQVCALPRVIKRRRLIYWIALIFSSVLVTSSWWIPLLPESLIY